MTDAGDVGGSMEQGVEGPTERYGLTALCL